MIDIDKEQTEIKQYLLHRLDEKRQRSIEERFLIDSDFREVVLIVEDELIEDYLAGLLMADERENFVNHYLSAPRQLEELRLSKAIREYATQGEEEGRALDAANAATTRGRHKIINLLLGKGWLPALAVVAFLLFIAVAVTWNLAGRWHWGDQQAVRNAEVALLNRQPSNGESALTVKLTSALSRAPQPGQKVTIPDGINIVQLLLDLPRPPYQSYEATLQVTDGPEVFTVSGLHAEDTAEGRLVKLRIPARLLMPEDYILSVRGMNDAEQSEDITEYVFRVVK